jgi:hypothetical protein
MIIIRYIEYGAEPGWLRNKKMPSLDYFVGFLTEPKNLERFLEKQGYVLSRDQPAEKGDRNYESEKGIDLFYFSKTIEGEDDEVPDWGKSGHEIVSELMISTKEDDAIDEAERIAKEIVEEYSAVFYDNDLDEFFRKGEM